eukprot:5897611-Amphidinium_carterae.1
MRPLSNINTPHVRSLEFTWQKHLGTNGAPLQTSQRGGVQKNLPFNDQSHYRPEKNGNKEDTHTKPPVGDAVPAATKTTPKSNTSREYLR